MTSRRPTDDTTPIVIAGATGRRVAVSPTGSRTPGSPNGPA